MPFSFARRAGNLFLALSVLAVLHSAVYATDIVQTLAGGGSLEGYKPEEANLFLGTSQGLAISPIGELYVSDSVHNQVLKISPTTGRISIYAGNGTAAYFGDGTPAPSAGLNTPGGLAFDAKGNLLIVDRGNFVVRSVDAVSGLISTIAGNGLFTGQVVGTNPAAGLGDGGQALQATFSGAMGDITVSSTGDIIVADGGNACVRKFTVGGTIATIAGTPQTAGFGGDGAAATAAKLSGPTGVVLDSSGNLYIGDSGNRRVRRVDTGATITTVAGSGAGGGGGFSGDGGPALNANIGSIGGLAFDKAGRLLITCNGAGRIRAVDFTTTLILTIAGGGTTLGDLGPATGANLSGPRDIAVDSTGNLYIYDSGNGRIRRVDAATLFIDTVIGTGVTGLIGDRGPKQFSVLVGPQGATFDAAGNLYVADTGDNSIRKVAADGTVTTIAGTGNPNGLGDGGPGILGNLAGPTDVLFLNNTLYVVDSGHGRIRGIGLTSNGNEITTVTQVPNPTAIVADATGLLYVTTNNQIATVAADGTTNVIVGITPVNTVANPLGNGLSPVSANLSNPSGIALGPGGDIYIADTGHNLIRLIHGGVTSTFAGGGTPTFPSVGDGGPATSASLNAPQGLTLDAAGTHLIVSDSGNNRLRSIDLTTNVISTICGTGVAGFSGDGDVVATALVNNPTRIFVHAGSLVFADTNNNRVRRIVTATDIDPKLVALTAKLDFTIDKKTGQPSVGKDSVALKAGLALPAGIAAANLRISVDIVDLHDAVQLDAMGKLPKPVKAAKTAKGAVPVFNFTLPNGQVPPVSKFSIPIKGTSVAGGKPVSFSYSSKGTFREELGRAGLTDITTSKDGVALPVRVTITLNDTVFTGALTVLYKSTQGKSGSATVKK
jgi:sugar lactone lactonase YvrE